MKSLLLIDRETTFLNSAAPSLRTQFNIVGAENLKDSFEILRTRNISVVLIELSLFEESGSDLIQTIRREIDPHLPVIVIAEQTNLEQAVEAMRNGAYDLTLKGLNPDLLLERIARALRYKEMEMRVQLLHTNVADKHDRFVFASDVMKKTHFEIARLADQEFDVLLTGETGVGKDLLAFELHHRSPRANKPFITLPIRSLSETLVESELFGHEKGAFSGADSMKIGKLEAADQGTLYIPEVSSLTELLQLKLLHFLQYKTITRVGQDSRKPEIPVNVRFVFATNKKMEEEVARGHLREDFYYRISGVRISIPPLRERIDDIEPLINYFLTKYAPLAVETTYSIAPDLRDAFRRYQWPGNVREVENCVKHMLAKTTGGILKLSDSPLYVDKDAASQVCRVCLGTQFANFTDYSLAEIQFKRAYFSVLLDRMENNITLAAAKAGMTPQGLRKVIKTLKLDKH